MLGAARLRWEEPTKHFELLFTLLFNSPVQGRLTTGVVQRPDTVVKFSKEGAQNMRKMQCAITSVARNSVSEGQRLQKGPGICGRILRSLRLSFTQQQLHKAGLVVVDLCCGQGDWLLATYIRLYVRRPSPQYRDIVRILPYRIMTVYECVCILYAHVHACVHTYIYIRNYICTYTHT